MNGAIPTGSERAPAPHRAALSTLIVFYTMGLAGMAFLLGVTTTPMVKRLVQAHKGRGPVRTQARPQAAPRLASLAMAPSRPTVRRRRQARVRRAAVPASEQRRRSTTRRRAARVRTARKPVSAQKRLRTARRPEQRLQRMRVVFLPRRSPDIAWVNPPPSSWPKECRPPEPGSTRRF